MTANLYHTTMSQQKLCPHCSLWSPWNGHIDDKCLHCSEYLKLAERIDQEEKEQKRRKLEFNFRERFPLSIKADDPWWIKGSKQAIYAVYFVFMSIMVTILWIVFWLAT
ncbi:hypothetical protein GC194_12080 [bacterium]|nr:hypothetical protein [bacterium]